MSAVADVATRAEMPAMRRRPITVAMYQRMGQAGIFAPGERVELIEGELFDMAPIGSEHSSVVKYLNRIFTVALQERAIVSVQDPIRLGEHSEPQPDIALARPPADFYRQAHPGPEDILLLIEVADIGARYDRELKVPLYARHGIPEVWLFDLPQKRLEVCHGAEAGEYRHLDLYRAGRVSPQAFPDVAMDLATLSWTLPDASESTR